MSNEGLKFIRDTFKHNFIRSYAFFYWGINGTIKDPGSPAAIIGCLS